jgi:UDP:flavonoid glycosyltransferase YjiC (YdhE family)
VFWFRPRSIEVRSRDPNFLVFSAADVVVCHGGSGTSLGALSTGLPLVIHPMFADQFINAETIAATGSCLVVRSKDSRELTSAIETVLADDSYRIQARVIADEIASMPDIADAFTRLAGSSQQ